MPDPRTQISRLFYIPIVCSTMAKTAIILFFTEGCNASDRAMSVLEQISYDLEQRSCEIVLLDADRELELAEKIAITKTPSLYYKHKHGLVEYTEELIGEAIIEFIANVSINTSTYETKHPPSTSNMHREAETATLVLFHMPNCAACKEHVPLVIKLRSWLRENDIAFESYDVSENLSKQKEFDVEYAPSLYMKVYDNVYHMEEAFTTMNVKQFARRHTYKNNMKKSDQHDCYFNRTIPSSTTSALTLTPSYDTSTLDITAIPEYHDSMSLCIHQSTDILGLHKSWAMPVMCLWLNATSRNTRILHAWHACSQLTSKCAWMHAYTTGEFSVQSAAQEPPCVCIFSNERAWVGIDATKINALCESPQNLMNALRRLYYSIR